MARAEKWPENRAIKIGDDNWVTYHGRPIGQVIPTGRFYSGGKEQFWTNTANDFCYSRDGAAYELAVRHVRRK